MSSWPKVYKREVRMRVLYMDFSLKKKESTKKNTKEKKREYKMQKKKEREKRLKVQTREG